MFSVIAQATGEPRYGFLISYGFLILGLITFYSIPSEEFESKSTGGAPNITKSTSKAPLYGALPAFEDDNAVSADVSRVSAVDQENGEIQANDSVQNDTMK